MEKKINLPIGKLMMGGEGAVKFFKTEEKEEDQSEAKIELPQNAIEFSGKAEAQEDLQNEEVQEDQRALKIDEDRITTDPLPTPANESKIFHEAVQMGLVDMEEEGGAQPYTSNIVNSTETIGYEGLSLSKFSPGNVQNALRDKESEGGIVVNKSASMMRSDDPANDGMLIKQSSQSDDESMNKYRLYGFTIQYKEGNKIVTVQVSNLFDDMDTAMVSINGAKYLMPKGDGFKVVDIASGAPIISYMNQAIYQHVDSEWKRV